MNVPEGEALVSIDQTALLHNLDCLTRRLDGSEVIAVVKADAYGHGAVSVSRVLEQNGVSWFAVARLHEAEQLRAQGVLGRILMLEAVDASHAQRALEKSWTPLLSNLPQIHDWAEATKDFTVPLAVHLKIDSGLHRLGLDRADLAPATEVLEQAPGLRLEAVCSHFSRSEELDGDTTAEEELRFQTAVSGLTKKTRSTVKLHLANSCGARYWPTSRFDFVRCGGALYGLDLTAGNQGSEAHQLRPVMSVSAPIVQIRELQAGESLGYGGRFVAKKATRVAVLPIGYADGYSSHLAEKAHVLIHQKRCSVLGAISMDRITVDVSEVPGAQVKDRAIVLGNQGDSSISATDLAGWGSSSLYETTTRFGLRMGRQLRSPDG